MKRQVYDLTTICDDPPIKVASNSFSFYIEAKDGRELTISVKSVTIDKEAKDATLFYDIEWLNKGPTFYEEPKSINVSEIKSAEQVYIKYETIKKGRRNQDPDFAIEIPHKDSEGNIKIIKVNVDKGDFICIIRDPSKELDESAIYGCINDVVETAEDEVGLDFTQLKCDKGIYSYANFILNPEGIKGVYKYGVKATKFIRKAKSETNKVIDNKCLTISE